MTPLMTRDRELAADFPIGRVIPVNSLGRVVTDLHSSFRHEFGTPDTVKLIGLCSPGRLHPCGFHPCERRILAHLSCRDERVGETALVSGACALSPSR